jgi:AcrR family transcriptional regulator
MQLTAEAKRRRRKPEIAREEILAVARRLLLSKGPAAVTLQAVAGELGMTHVNLLHHFGSAAGLRSALVAEMARAVAQVVEDASARVHSGAAEPRQIVDLVFDALDEGGAGRLIAWMALAGETAQLEPLFDAVRSLTGALEAVSPSEPSAARKRITSAILSVLLPGIGDALIGPELHHALGRERGVARDVATAALASAFAEAGAHSEDA